MKLHSVFAVVMLIFGVLIQPSGVNAADGAITPNVVIEYGSKLEDVDFIVENMKSRGIEVKLQTGYANASCGRVTVNGRSVEFDQDSIYDGDLGSFIHMQTLGKKVYDMPSCKAKN